MRILPVVLLLSILAALGLPAPLAAQGFRGFGGRDDSRDWGSRDWGSRDSSGRGDRERSPWGSRGDEGGGGFRFDPKDFLTRMDANGDGVLEASELQGPGARFAQRLAERANLPTDKPLQISALVSSFESSSSSGDSDRDRDRNRSDSSRSSTSKQILLVPGFGVDEKLPQVPGFGAAWIQTNTTPLEDRYEQWVIDQVNDTLRRYDKNKNTMLDFDEWSEVNWSSDPKESDTNSDTILTRDELAERFAKRRGSGWKQAGKPSSSTPASTSGGPPKSDADKSLDYARDLMSRYDTNRNSVLDRDEYAEIKGDWASADYDRNGNLTIEEIARKVSEGSSSAGGARSGGSGSFYRASSPKDRLPSGLPSWFAKCDLDGDGQVSVAEYANPWSDAKAAEFQKWDLNGDGFVPPDECLLAESGGQRPATSSASPARSYSAGPSSSGSSYSRPGGSMFGGPPRSEYGSSRDSSRSERGSDSGGERRRGFGFGFGR